MQPEKDIEALKSVSSLEVQQEIVDGHFIDSCNLHQAWGRVPSMKFFLLRRNEICTRANLCGFHCENILQSIGNKEQNSCKHPKSYAGGSSSCQNL